jgi:tetratricopeptide (TPR) repeat protein
MAITLKLGVDEGGLVVTFDGQTVKTALDKLPAIISLQADPFTNGQVLTAALGGDEMLRRLADDPDNLILLDCDDKADAFAWEFATLPDRQFLCVKAGMLRVVQKTSEVLKTSEVSTLNFIALAADPLVNQDGSVRDGYRLDLDNEMKAIRETLRSCGKNLEAKRIPPTREELYKALRKGPAILHLSCHGNVVPTEYGPMAMLALEKNDGSIDAFLGSDLMNTKRGILRMVVLSACKTATGTEANLAHALALNGVPMTIGMQGSIDDRLSDDFATALYDSLFQGFTFGEALQQARQNIARSTRDVGLPVGYVSANGWSEAFPIQQGTPSVGGLGKPGESALGGEIQPPRPLLGRNLELHQIAKHFTNGGKVLTVAGTGGMGKTALAASFAERFAWLWTRGVSGYSFANEVNAANFRYALMRVLFGNEGAQQGASLSESEQREAILKAAREWSGLWLFDNYESIIQGIQENQPEAESIHRLIADLANGDADMLLTSREQPAGLRNERLFPDGNHALHGLGDGAGVELFFQHSVKAKEKREAHEDFALAVQRAAEGHPLAIALLAGEYDVSAVPMQAFLGNWQDELANARRGGLAGHHVTFTIAFERSYAHLSKDLQEKLASLSIFPFPFFAHGAEMIWDGSPLPDGDEEMDARVNAAQQTLSEFTRRSLLEVDATYRDDNTPATYRFQPALRQEAARRLDSSLMVGQQNGYAAYGVWLAKHGFVGFHKDLALNRLVRLSMDAMEKATNSLQGVEQLHHIRRLAWLKNAWGETRLAFDLLNSAISEDLPNVESDPKSAKVESVLRYELAGIYVIRGDIDRALNLYEESLELDKQLGDKNGQAKSLGSIAQVFVHRGDLDRAIQHYQESQELLEQLGDKKGVTTIKRWLAVIAQQRGDLDNALRLFEDTLIIAKELGDMVGQASSLSQMAMVYLEKKDFEKAQHFTEQNLEINSSLNNQKGIANGNFYLGIIAQIRGNKEAALSHYRAGLVIFERMDMPEAERARKMIASLEGSAVSSDDPLSQVLAQVRDASQRGDVQSAIQYQEQAVSLARGAVLTGEAVSKGAGEGREELVNLSVILYNLAGFYQKAERHDDAVKAMEEVVAIDEQTGHQDLETDRETLETFRRIASLSPEEREQLRQQAKEEQGSPIENAANQVRDAGLAYIRKQAPKRDVLQMLEDASKKMRDGESAGSAWLEVAALCDAVVALIKEESIPSVPAAYVGHFSAVQSEMKK